MEPSASDQAWPIITVTIIIAVGYVICDAAARDGLAYALKEYGPFAGSLLGIFSAYIAARYTIKRKEEIDEQRTALAFYYAMHKILYSQGTAITELDCVYPNLGIARRVVFCDFSDVSLKDSEISDADRSAFKKVCTDIGFYFSKNERIFDFSDKTIILKPRICGMLEKFINFSKIQQEESIESISSYTGLQLEKIKKILEGISSCYLLSIKIYFDICRTYKLDPKPHTIPGLTDHIKMDPTLTQL